MLARGESVFKWSLYAAAALLCFVVQAAVLQRITVWGVIPFLYPLLAVLPAIFESPSSGVVFSLAVGVVCDLLLPAPLPCFYTLIFPPAALCASLLSRSLLPNKALCALAALAAALALTDIFHCLILWASDKAAWGAGLFVMLREFCVTAPLAIPAMLLFRAVYNKTHLYD